MEHFLLSIMALETYSPMKYKQGIQTVPFLHTLTCTSYLLFTNILVLVTDNEWSDVVNNCGFGLHFSGDY